MWEIPEFKADEILIYLRKSRTDNPLLSVEEVLANHEKMLDEWAERNLPAGQKIPEANRYREIVSGETIESRPQVQELLRRIESPLIKAVLVVEPQRLSRGDLEDIGRLVKLFRYSNTIVITLQYIYDLRNEHERDSFERELKRGNEFLEYQKRIMGRGVLLSVSQGNYLGSIPPYGYNKTWVMEGKRKRPTLEINEEQAKIVRMIFDLYVNHDMGAQKICVRLDALHIPPPKGQYWSPNALKDMLSNIHYIGKVKWNCRKGITTVEDSEIVKSRPKAKPGEYLVFDGKHEAIITEELFNAAQAKTGSHARIKGATKIRNPFAGLLYCECGRIMALHYDKKKDGTLRYAVRLSCPQQRHCHNGSCTEEEMQRLVRGILARHIEDFEVQLSNQSANLQKTHQEHINRLKSRLATLEQKERNIWNKYTEEQMPKHIFDDLKESVLRDIDEVRLALADAESRPKPIDYEDRIRRFKEALAALNDLNASPEEQNRLLKACIDRIEYRRESPQRLKSTLTHKVPVGGGWTSPPIELDVKLKT